MAKHPNEEFRRLIKNLNEKEGFKKNLYPRQEHRKISWPEYNFSKINELKEVLTIVKEFVNEVDCPRDKGVGRPSVNPKVLAKAIFFCELVGLPERQAQGWLEIIGPFLGIHEKLDDRVIGEGYNRLDVLMILQKVFYKTKISDGKLGGDGSGLERSRKENYESTKKKNAGRYMTSIVDSREIVQAFDISGTQECQIMHELIKDVEGDSLRLDAGFNDKNLAMEIANKRMVPYIYLKKNNNMNGNLYWQEMCYKFYNDLVAWLINYHQRSHTESFHSAFKRKFGIITKLRFNCKFVQVCARIILHNISRISYFKRLQH
ncbi:MAG: hypothetical protein ACOC1P_00080 [Minisyncoccales bacterium]